MIAVGSSDYASVPGPFTVDVDGGSDRLFIAAIGIARSPPGIAPPVTLNGIEGAILYEAVNVAVDTQKLMVAYWLHDDLPDAGTFTLDYVGSGDAANRVVWANFSGVSQTPPESTQAVNTDFATTNSATVTPRSEGSLALWALFSVGTFESSSSGTKLGPDTGAFMLYRTDGDTIDATMTAIGRWTSFAASFAAASGARIAGIGDDDTIADGESSVPVAGEELPTSGAVSLRSGSISEPQSVADRAPGGFTWSTVTRGDLPYTDSYHSHDLVVEADPADLTRAVTFNPPAGFAAYPLHPDHANQTSGESILAGLTITSGMQIKVPSSVVVGGSPVDITWEISSGYATGRIASLDTVLTDDIELTGVEIHSGTSWDDIPVTLTPSGEVATPGVVIELTTSKGTPVPNQSGITAVVRESVTAPGVLYQTGAASIANSTMTLNSPLIGNVGDTVCVTLLSADGQVGGLWPEAPVIDLT